MVDEYEPPSLTPFGVGVPLSADETVGERLPLRLVIEVGVPPPRENVPACDEIEVGVHTEEGEARYREKLESCDALEEEVWEEVYLGERVLEELRVFEGV